MNTVRACYTCRFWTPTERVEEFGDDDPVVGRCDPAGSDYNWSPGMPTWPAVALSSDGESGGGTGAILLTNAGFGCSEWRARADGDDE